MSSRLKENLGIVALLVAAIAAYFPGLNGPFIFDDFGNIVHNYFLAIDALNWEQLRDAAMSSRSGVLRRPLAMLSFALNYYASGGSLSAFAFKLTNVGIHCANTLLVFLLFRQLLRAWLSRENPAEDSAPPAVGRIALAETTAVYVPYVAAALWALHPLQLTNVLYVVQRMNSLCVMFCLLGLVLFVYGRSCIERTPTRGLLWMCLGVGGGTLLGLGAKENAIVVPFLAFAIELWFFSFADLRKPVRRLLTGFYGLTVLLPFVAIVAVLLLRPEFLTAGYEGRDFTMVQRALTQTRVLGFYVFLLVYPNLRNYNLFHDDVELSQGLFDPLSTLVAVAGWTVILALAVWKWRSRPLWAFGLVWYLIAHGVESSVIALELVFEHRNYLPTAGLIFVAAYYLVRALGSISARIAVAIPLVMILTLSFTTYSRAGIWGDPDTLSYFLARNNPDGMRARKTLAYKQVRDGVEISKAFTTFSQIAQLDGHTVDPVIEMIKILVGYHGAKFGSPLPELPATAAPVSFNEVALREDQPFLLSLLVALDGEVHRRLRKPTISAEGMAGLVSVQECIRSDSQTCTPIAEMARRWHETALANERTSALLQARIGYSLAHLEFFNGNTKAAIALMKEAIVRDPEDISFSLELSALYIHIRDFTSADRLIEELEASIAPGQFRAREVLAMRAHWEASKRQSAAGEER